MEIKWLQKQKRKLASIIKCTPKLTEKKRLKFRSDQRVLGRIKITRMPNWFELLWLTGFD